MKRLLTRLSLSLMLLLAVHAGAADTQWQERDAEWQERDRLVDFHPGRAISQARASIEQAKVKGDKAAELKALLLLSHAYANIAETALHGEVEERGEALARELGDVEAICFYTDGRAWVKWEEGRHDEAMALWDEAIALAERHHLDTRRAWIYSNKGTSLFAAGRKAEAMNLYSTSYSLFERLQHSYGMSMMLQYIGAMYGGAESSAQDQAKAAEYYGRALELIDPRVYRRFAAFLYVRLGLAHYRRGQIDLARPLLEKSAAIFRMLDFPVMVATSQFHLGNIYKDEQRFAEALAQVESARTIFQQHPQKELLIRVLATRAELLATLGRKKETMEALAEAKALFPEIDVPPVAIYFYVAVANTYARLGDYAEAFRQLQAARAADRRMTEAVNAQLGDELRVRFEVQLKDAENVLLRSQRKEAESRRLALSLALALSVFVLGGAAFYLRKRAAAARAQAAHHQALATAEARRAETLEAANATLEQLATTGHQITASLQADKVFDALYRDAGMLMDVSSLSIWLVEEDRIHLRFSLFDAEHLTDTCVPVSDATSRVARCVRERGELLVEFAAGRDEAAAAGTATRTALLSPLLAGGQVLGVLLVESAKPGAYGERERQIMRTLSAYCAVALSNAANTQRLIAASQAKSTFLANMSHELRSPLNAMLGFTQLLLRDRQLAAGTQQDLSIVLRSGEHLHMLINQVLDLSKIEAGRITLNAADFDLYELLDELVDMFTITARQKGLQLLIDNDPDVPKIVHADGIKLRQVLINLINNALKFTAEGGVALHVNAACRPPDCVLSFEVTDTGPGIAADEIDKLGGAFIQAAAGQQAQEGTGLGLAISSSFIRLMGGDLKLRSQLGEGTTVSFDLPVQIGGTWSAASAPEKSRRVVGLAPDQPHYRILAVDDRIEGRQLLVRLLAPLGFELREASNGEEALAIWESWAPHLIWMDLRMPVMSGWEAARRIKATEKGKSTIVIALTASGLEEQHTQVLADGCDDFLRKPFREHVLLEMLQKHLGVKFIYDEEAAPASAPQSKVDLTALPAALANELVEALEKLDVEAIEQTIDTIRGYDADTARTLSELARNFQYEGMLAMLHEVREAQV